MSEPVLSLPTLPMNSRIVPVDTLVVWRDGGKLDLDAPYQRGVVWGVERRRNFIKSMITGVPIPALVINDRFAAGDFVAPDGYTQARSWARVVIDGKQRITTILGFIDGDFGVPAQWYGGGSSEVVFWGDLPKSEQLRFENALLPVSMGTLGSMDAEAEVFDLINFGGLPQGEADVI